MFANFKVSSAGVGSTKASKRHQRSTKGCQTCRIRRKKCDELRPVCGRCRRDPNAACAWGDSVYKDVPCSSERVSARHRRPAVPTTPQLSLTSYLSSHKSSSSSQDQIDLLVHTFNSVFCVSFVDPRQSIISQGIPYAIQQPGLMHAYAACGAAMLSQRDEKWKTASLLHYNKAIKSVSEALIALSIDHAKDAEWLLAAINMLHIFETLRHDGFRPNTLHLAATRRISEQNIFAGSHMSYFTRTVLSEYIFAITIASIFHPFCSGSERSFLHIGKLVETLAAAEARDGLITDGGQAANPIDHARPIFDWIFRLSHLRMRVPLVGQDLIEGRAVLAFLETWKPPLDDASSSGAPAGAVQMAELYRSAALILVHKILEPGLTADSVAIQPYKRRGMEILLATPDTQMRDASVLLWPIFILGLSATTTEEQNSCQRPLYYLFSHCGIGCTRKILDLLQQAWGGQGATPNQPLGLDILFQDDLLSQVMF